MRPVFAAYFAVALNRLCLAGSRFQLLLEKTIHLKSSFTQGPVMPLAPSLLWIGDYQATLEFQLAAADSALVLPLRQAPDVTTAIGLPSTDDATLEPTIVCLAEPRPGIIRFADIIALSRRWPLARIVSVASCLADGQRRSGPTLPGVMAVPWHDFAARLRCWVAELASGRPGSLGHPVTARRDERWQPTSLSSDVDHTQRRLQVTVASATSATAEAVSDLVRVAGGEVVQQLAGRPAIADESPCIIWDCGERLDSALGWLHLLAGQRPGRLIILLCSFPRGDTVAAARAAGAAAVLGRPADREALSGLLL